jgi:hypothetical protein
MRNIKGKMARDFYKWVFREKNPADPLKLKAENIVFRY